MEQLNDEELQEVEGGAAGYGNVQFTCQCGKVIGTETNFMKHLAQTMHTTGTVYYQQEKGKLSQGRKIGKVISSRKILKNGNTVITLKYPNGKKSSGEVGKDGIVYATIYADKL